MVMTTKQKRRHLDTNSVSINTPSGIITPTCTERLLGAEIHEDMKWREHVLDSGKSMVKTLNKRVGALKKIQKMASFKSRKMIGTGIFISKLIYLMPLWLGCEDYMVKALQVIQNKAARSIAKLSIFPPIKTLLKTCGWMSVRQNMAYHSMFLLHKTIQNQAPEYLYKKVTAAGEFTYKTRQAASCPAEFSFDVQHPTDSGKLRQEPGSKMKNISKQGWCWKSVGMYNTLPTDLRLEGKLKIFKKRLKKWVELNISI